LTVSSCISQLKEIDHMRMSRFTWIVLGLLLAAPFAHADVITIKTGQYTNAPGVCLNPDDTFHYWTPQPQCGQPIVSAPFGPADFESACAGPYAVVIDPYTGVWISELPCDPDARWISSGTNPGSCFGSPLSTLYCAHFNVSTECTVADSVRICWAVDDFLGDQPPTYPGPNPGGVYINGVDLGPAFSGPGSNPEYSAVAYNVPLNLGGNTLAVYQRDAGCGLGGLILSAKIYIGCGSVPTEETSWGAIKSIYR
jgi:hypothetical protein